MKGSLGPSSSSTSTNMTRLFGYILQHRDELIKFHTPLMVVGPCKLCVLTDYNFQCDRCERQGFVKFCEYTIACGMTCRKCSADDNSCSWSQWNLKLWKSAAQRSGIDVDNVRYVEWTEYLSKHGGAHKLKPWNKVSFCEYPVLITTDETSLQQLPISGNPPGKCWHGALRTRIRVWCISLSPATTYLHSLFVNGMPVQRSIPGQSVSTFPEALARRAVDIILSRGK